jgi:hypothetical protein
MIAGASEILPLCPEAGARSMAAAGCSSVARMLRHDCARITGLLQWQNCGLLQKDKSTKSKGRPAAAFARRT